MSILTGEKSADLLKAGNLGINGGEKLGSVHADQCSSVAGIFLFKPFCHAFG
jgi:hypothetical protein